MKERVATVEDGAGPAVTWLRRTHNLCACSLG